MPPATAPHPRSNRSQPAVLAVISTSLQKNPHFSSLFCDFSLRSAIPLAIVQVGPGFPLINRGSSLAACFDSIRSGKKKSGG